MRCTVAILVSILCTQAFASNDSDHTEAALRQLHRATTTQPNGQHLLNLSALRALNDPDLRPFFNQFSQHTDWHVQVHAVLGIAELSNDHTIDPWLVQQISPTAREHVIAQALDDGLFQQKQIEILLQWPPLETAPRLLLLADLQLLQGTKNEAMLKELTNNTDLSVAMFAALLLGDPTAIQTTTQSLRRATNADKSVALARTLQLVRQYKLKDASPWLQSLLEENAVALSEDERYWVLYSMLSVDPLVGEAYWSRAFPEEPTRRNQAKYLLLLLEAGLTPSDEHITRLHIDLEDPLLGLMARAGRVNRPTSIVTTSDVTSLIKLVSKGHRGSAEWAFRVAKNHLSDSQAERFYMALSVIPEKANAMRKAAAIKAFVQLIDVAPASAWNILEQADDNSEQQKHLLLAMLQNPNKDIVEQATKLRRNGLNKADVMTLLLIARGSSPLPDIDEEYLGIIAAGGGHLSQSLETQAAWLYLKRMGLADRALAAVSPE
jgi:hypothetical protein